MIIKNWAHFSGGDQAISDLVKKEKGVPIRSVSRTLAVLKLINRHDGISMKFIAESIGVPYPTAVRIVRTLIFEGMVRRDDKKMLYRVAPLAKSLSCGIKSSDKMVSAARPLMTKITNDLGWPVVLGRRVGAYIVIEDSTHELTTQTFSEYAPGFTLPLQSSASGLLYLAHCSEELRASILEELKTRFMDDPLSSAKSFFNPSKEAFEEIRSQGYAIYWQNPYTKDPGKTSAFAVPIFLNEKMIGTLALVYFSSAMNAQQAVESFYKRLSQAADKISIKLKKKNYLESQ